MIYKVKLVSQGNAIVWAIVVLTVYIGGIHVFATSGIKNTVLLITIVISVACVAYLFWQKFVTGRTEWLIDNDQIKIVWIKKFPLADINDIILKWDDIENIKKRFDPNFYNLVIRLSNGGKLIFYHDVLTTRDDFEEMLAKLYQTFNDKKVTANKRIESASQND